MDTETEFLCGLIELQYGQEVENKLRMLAENISWAKGWPKDSKSFWNAEAFMWNHKIDKQKRELIAAELGFLKSFLTGKEKEEGKKKEKSLDINNLDIGCGAYSYIPSVGLDFSEKMLQFNENCTQKIAANLEEKLPLENNSFASVTAVFVLNYVQNYGKLLLEISRVLKENGFLVIVLYSKQVNDWQRQKEINRFSSEEWRKRIEKAGFSVHFYEKDDLWFFKCRRFSPSRKRKFIK